MSSWHAMNASQKNFYMQFYAPVSEDNKVTPQDNDLIPAFMFTPSQIEMNSVIDTGDSLVRTLNYRLSDMMHNAVLFWMQENL